MQLDKYVQDVQVQTYSPNDSHCMLAAKHRSLCFYAQLQTNSSKCMFIFLMS